MPKAAMGRNRKTTAPAPTPEVVDPRWLLKAFAFMVLIALLCGYLTLCGLFYHGQWQLVLHPAQTSAAPPTVGGVPFEVIHFGAEATGVPQLTGWWIPAGAGAAYAHLTILYLPNGDGSLADDQATLANLHDLGTTVFAIDYRGYGQSASLHPSERSMAEDAGIAWEYLTDSRGLRSDRIIPYGDGIGVSLALHLAAARPSIPAIVLDRPDFDVEQRVREDSRSRFLPVHLLLRERFALLPALDTLKTPKLILTRGERENSAVLGAADPKMTVALPASSPEEFRAAVKRFLDLYAPPTPAPALVPRPAPSAQKQK